MRTPVLVLCFVFSSCEILKLKFSENNVDYAEKIKIDGKSVEYMVPKHGGLQKSDYLIDYDAKLVAMKRYEEKKCYVYDMPKHMYKPDEVKEGVKKHQGQFPEDKYMVTKEYIVPLYYLNATTLSVKMRDFCGLFPVMKVASFDSKKDMEANFFSLMTTKGQGNRQKRSRDYYSCTQEGSYQAKKCQMLGLMPTGKYCQYKSSGCIYKVICKQIGLMVWDCPQPDHLYNYILFCCDYTCD